MSMIYPKKHPALHSNYKSNNIMLCLSLKDIHLNRVAKRSGRRGRHWSEI